MHPSAAAFREEPRCRRRRQTPEVQPMRGRIAVRANTRPVRSRAQWADKSSFARNAPAHSLTGRRSLSMAPSCFNADDLSSIVYVDPVSWQSLSLSCLLRVNRVRCFLSRQERRSFKKTVFRRYVLSRISFVHNMLFKASLVRREYCLNLNRTVIVIVMFIILFARSKRLDGREKDVRKGGQWIDWIHQNYIRFSLNSPVKLLALHVLRPLW